MCNQRVEWLFQRSRRTYQKKKGGGIGQHKKREGFWRVRKCFWGAGDHNHKSPQAQDQKAMKDALSYSSSSSVQDQKKKSHRKSFHLSPGTPKSDPKQCFSFGRTGVAWGARLVQRLQGIKQNEKKKSFCRWKTKILNEIMKQYVTVKWPKNWAMLENFSIWNICTGKNTILEYSVAFTKRSIFFALGNHKLDCS